MTKLNSGHSPKEHYGVTATMLHEILGDIDESKILAIMDLQPTLLQLEEALLWAVGDGDVLGKTNRPMDLTVARIVDIIVAGEEEEQRPPAA